VRADDEPGGLTTVAQDYLKVIWTAQEWSREKVSTKMLAEKIGVSRQILSNHLACLRGCGLVVAVPEGRRSRYELADAHLGHALTDLLSVVLAVDPHACADPDCC